MTILEFNCPNCGAVLNVPAHQAGQRGRCQFCDVYVHAPNADASSSALSTPVWARISPRHQGGVAIVVFIALTLVSGVLLALYESPISNIKSPTDSEKPPQHWIDIANQDTPPFPPIELTDGFRGIAWGTDLSTLPEFQTYASNEATESDFVEVFTRIQEWPKLDTETLSEVKYYQFKSKFYKVELSFQDDTHTLNIAESLRLVLGDYLTVPNDTYGWNLGSFEYYDDNPFNTTPQPQRISSILVVLYPKGITSPPKLKIEYRPVSMEKLRLELAVQDEVQQKTENEHKSNMQKDFYGDAEH